MSHTSTTVGILSRHASSPIHRHVHCAESVQGTTFREKYPCRAEADRKHGHVAYMLASTSEYATTAERVPPACKCTQTHICWLGRSLPTWRDTGRDMPQDDLASTTQMPSSRRYPATQVLERPLHCDICRWSHTGVVSWCPVGGALSPRNYSKITYSPIMKLHDEGRSTSVLTSFARP